MKFVTKETVKDDLMNSNQECFRTQELQENHKTEGMCKCAQGQTYREKSLALLGYKLEERPVGQGSGIQILIQDILGCQINEKMTKGSHVQWGGDVMLYNNLGSISDIFHSNNQNCQLERRVPQTPSHGLEPLTQVAEQWL